MTPYYADDWLTIYSGDSRAVLATLPADSVDCVVTSPPYWGLRDYGNEGQLGLERTPEEYVANMVAVFAEVRRVLKPSGTCWLNLGDSYAGSTQTGRNDAGRPEKGRGWAEYDIQRTKVEKRDGLKPKDLVGIPWRVAFALQADGWYLRSDIIWAKPNPMPESVTDRPTKAHEYLFLLTKSARYYFDADAVREPQTNTSQEDVTARAGFNAKYQGQNQKANHLATQTFNPAGRNIRSVWTIATRPYPGAHFAVFPPELPERCIKAGSSEKGVCPECGAPWERGRVKVADGSGRRVSTDDANRRPQNHGGASWVPVTYKDEGWRPTCKCGPAMDEYHDAPHYPQPAVVLDPFAGSGTTGMVAQKLGRRAILIDLNPDYLKQQLARNAQTPLGLDAA